MKGEIHCFLCRGSLVTGRRLAVGNEALPVLHWLASLAVEIATEFKVEFIKLELCFVLLLLTALFH